MAKVLTLEERDKSKSFNFSEQWNVNFYIQGQDKFWRQSQTFYYTVDKNKHKDVLNRFNKDYKHCVVKNISVHYV